MEILLLVLAALLAFANGANDNPKGVATLVGHGAASPRIALAWAAATTALGALVGVFAGGGLLLHAFSASIVGAGSELSTRFFTAVLAGAVAWVLFATRAGLPVSTTHAILGGLGGAGLYEVGAAQIEWGALAQKVALPLLASPLLALALVFVAARPLAVLARRNESRCLCAVETLEPVSASGAAVARRRRVVVAGETATCAVHSPSASVSNRGATQALH